MSGIENKDWSARRRGSSLHVQGQVLVNTGGDEPVLSEKSSDSNPLQLNLEIVPGVGADVLTRKSADYERLVSDEFSRVDVFNAGQMVVSIPVE